MIPPGTLAGLYSGRTGGTPAVAVIDEAACIGCALCLEACPVDAIVGAPALMHTVIAAECIGCRLCLPPCPVDCIDLVPPPGPWTQADARGAKRRAFSRKKRNSRQTPRTTPAERKAVIAAALMRKTRA